jgi:hypothetical protein
MMIATCRGRRAKSIARRRACSSDPEGNDVQEILK